MDGQRGRKRGRPPKPTDHPVGLRLRQRREAMGLTVRQAAVRAGLRLSSASYLSQLESGARIPGRALARRLAEVLGENPRLLLAWASTGRRSGPLETARAVQTLAELLRHPAYGVSPAPLPPSPSAPPETPAELVPLVRDRASSARPVVPALGPGSDDSSIPAAKLLVPELEEGADPGGGARPLAMHRLTPGTVATLEPLLRPFAYRLSRDGARRVRDALGPGDVALLTRRVWPPEPAAPCAVRLSGHVVLARVLWNDRQLLLLPGPGDRDFIVLDAPDRTSLEWLLAGRVVATLRPTD